MSGIAQILPGTGRGTMRSMVEGTLRASNDRLSSPERVGHHAQGRDAYHFVSILFDEASADVVSSGAIAHVVNAPINFDG